MGVSSLPKTVTRQRRGYDLNPGLLRLRTKVHTVFTLSVFTGLSGAFIAGDDRTRILYYGSTFWRRRPDEIASALG